MSHLNPKRWTRARPVTDEEIARLDEKRREVLAQRRREAFWVWVNERRQPNGN